MNSRHKKPPPTAVSVEDFIANAFLAVKPERRFAFLTDTCLTFGYGGRQLINPAFETNQF